MSQKGKFVASIEARLGSSRLPGKVLRPIMGRPMLELMIERVRQAKQIDEIMVATTVNPNDDPLEDLAHRLGVKCYRGSEEDVLARVLEANLSVNGDHIVELWGDTPLIDPKIIDDAVSFYKINDFDCVGTCLDKTFPWGMSLLIFPVKILAEISKLTSDPVDRENVSNHIYEHPEKYKTGHLPCPVDMRRPDIRLTVDEALDLELVTKIFEALYPVNSRFDTRDILAFLDKYPQVLATNKSVKQRKARG